MGGCEKTSRIMAYHDGELPVEERQALESHVAECPVCGAELAGLRAVSERLRTADRPGVSCESTMRLWQQVRSVDERANWRLVWRLTAAAAVIVVVSLLGMNVSATQANGTTASWELAATWAGTELAGVEQGHSELAATGVMEYRTAHWIASGLSQGNGQGNQ